MATVPVIKNDGNPTPLAIARALRVLGQHVSDWRKLQWVRG